jgi:hypothetical protein
MQLWALVLMPLSEGAIAGYVILLLGSLRGLTILGVLIPLQYYVLIT